MDTTSWTLLEGIRRHDEASWSRFVDIYGPLIYSWCRRRGLDEDQSADVMQEILRRVAVGILSFRKENPGDTFRGWLRIVSNHCIIDCIRELNRRPRALGGTDMVIRLNELPASEPEADERAEVLLIARRALALVRTDYEPLTCKAFELTVLEGLPPVDVAKQLGISAAAVRQAKYRVLCRLREELAGLEEWL